MGETAVGISFKNPWWVVVGAVTGLFVCNGPVLAFTFGVFLKPLMADMGWDRAQASFALSFGGIFSAMMVPVFGWLMDRWSIRKVALPGIAIYAATIAAGPEPQVPAGFHAALRAGRGDERDPDPDRLRQGDRRVVRPPPRASARHRDGRRRSWRLRDASIGGSADRALHLAGRLSRPRIADRGGGIARRWRYGSGSRAPARASAAAR